MYVCNMHVVQRASGPRYSRDDAALLVADWLCDAPTHIPLVVGASGMGKTAVLTSGVKRAAARLSASIVFVPGGMVASEGHLVALLTGRRPERAHLTDSTLSAAIDARVAAEKRRCLILAIDDFDILLYKRQHLAEALAQALGQTRLRLAASAGTDAQGRIAGRNRPLSQVPNVTIHTLVLSTLAPAAARRLAIRRNSILSPSIVDRIVDLAGGHPAAIVFLSRLLRAVSETDGSWQEAAHSLLTGAAEFAGSVYSGPWASLGPQQRAIIAALAAHQAPVGAAQLAGTLVLSPSHISAQLTRLRAEGLLVQAARGRFAVSPLLAQWIGRRGSPAVAELPHPTALARGL